MKYRTITTTIPATYKWLAIDADGSICVYNSKPTINTEIMVWDTKNNYLPIGMCPWPADWTKTLRKLT